MNQNSASDESHEFIDPPTDLKDRVKVSGSGPGIDTEAIERAERAMELLSSQFDDWIKVEIDELLNARDRFNASPTEKDAIDELFRTAHDLKGQAPTFGFPLIGSVCGSLTRLIEGLGSKPPLPVELMNGHVDAVRAIIAADARGDGDETARELATELLNVTEEWLDRTGANG